MSPLLELRVTDLGTAVSPFAKGLPPELIQGRGGLREDTECTSNPEDQVPENLPSRSLSTYFLKQKKNMTLSEYLHSSMSSSLWATGRVEHRILALWTHRVRNNDPILRTVPDTIPSSGKEETLMGFLLFLSFLALAS